MEGRRSGSSWVMVGGRRNQVAIRSLDSVVGLPGLVGDLLRRVRSLEGDIAKMCLGSVLWSCLHSKKEQHSTAHQEVRKAVAGRGFDANVHRCCGERVELGSHLGYGPSLVYGSASVPIILPLLYGPSFVGNRRTGADKGGPYPPPQHQ